MQVYSRHAKYLLEPNSTRFAFGEITSRAMGFAPLGRKPNFEVLSEKDPAVVEVALIFSRKVRKHFA
jgi:hypothetical protein